jgi:hypothetical protein
MSIEVEFERHRANVQVRRHFSGVSNHRKGDIQPPLTPPSARAPWTSTAPAHPHCPRAALAGAQERCPPGRAAERLPEKVTSTWPPGRFLNHRAGHRKAPSPRPAVARRPRTTHAEEGGVPEGDRVRHSPAAAPTGVRLSGGRRENRRHWCGRRKARQRSPTSDSGYPSCRARLTVGGSRAGPRPQRRAPKEPQPSDLPRAPHRKEATPRCPALASPSGRSRSSRSHVPFSRHRSAGRTRARHTVPSRSPVSSGKHAGRAVDFHPASRHTGLRGWSHPGITGAHDISTPPRSPTWHVAERGGPAVSRLADTRSHRGSHG